MCKKKSHLHGVGTWLLFLGNLVLNETLLNSNNFCVNFPNSKKGYSVQSFGTGSVVKLPGPGPDQPNVYSFDTTYEEMYRDLSHKDFQLYP